VWDRLDKAVNNGDVGASEEVRLEIEKRDDEVYAWVKARKAKMSVPISEQQQRHVSSMLDKHERLVDTHGGTARRPTLSSSPWQSSGGARW
jgi:hypothetical protein